MKKRIQAYALISGAMSFELCFHAGVFYLLNGNNEKISDEGFFSFPMAIAFAFAFYNGILMAVAGIYLVRKGARREGWVTLICVLIFYLTALLIHFYDRPAFKF